MSEPSTSTEVTATVTPPDPQLDATKMASLAKEMAWNIQAPADIMAAYHITQQQFDYHILPHVFYKKAFDIHLQEWMAASSTVKRLSVKSAAALEDALPTIAARMTDKKELLSGVIETAKFFAKVSGAGEQSKEYAAGEKFSININLGNTRLHFEETLGPKPLVQLPEGPSQAPSLQTISEGQTGNTPVQ